MESHKMDNLFRDHASKYEVKPSVAAWDQISGQLNKKNNYAVYWKVAAVILLVTGIGYIMMQLDTRKHVEGIAVEATHPVQTDELAFEWKIQAQEHVQSESKSTVAVTNVNKESVKSVKTAQNSMLELVAFESFETERIRSTDIQLISPAEDFLLAPAFEKKASSKQSKVKITYIASNDDPAEKGALKKIFDYAKTNTPIDMLSDIRQAKNEFISNKISLD